MDKYVKKTLWEIFFKTIGWGTLGILYLGAIMAILIVVLVISIAVLTGLFTLLGKLFL